MISLFHFSWDVTVHVSKQQSDEPSYCTRIHVLTQAKPIVRVAVEVVRQGDLEALERGLAKLYQADPAVEISVQENGEHVITALGELHLEQCLKVGGARN